MAMSNPTIKQRAFLEARGIIVPPTKGSCKLLISYIKQGNGTVGNDESARIALTIAYQKKWVGEAVRAHASFAKGDGGVVRYLGARSVDDVMIFRDSGSTKLHPFEANVRFDNGKSQMLSLSNLELLGL